MKKKFKVKYPRFPKWQWLSRKLTKKDTIRVRRLYRAGWRYIDIARLLGVSSECVKRWTMTLKERQAYDKQRRPWCVAWIKAHPDNITASKRRMKKRKLQKCPKRYRAWKNEREIKSPHRKTEKFRKYIRDSRRKRYWVDPEYRRKMIDRAIEFKKRKRKRRFK